jgi:hypothetical protein
LHRGDDLAEDPYANLNQVSAICWTFKLRGYYDDEIKPKLFSLQIILQLWNFLATTLFIIRKISVATTLATRESPSYKPTCNWKNLNYIPGH